MKSNFNAKSQVELEQKYKESLAAFKQNVEQIVSGFKAFDAPDLRTYFFMISNLKYFFKNKFDHKYEAFFKALMLHRDLAAKDYFNLEYLHLMLDAIKVKRNPQVNIGTGGHIYCLFHMGSYRLPLAYLAKQHPNAKFALVIDREAYTSQAQEGLEVMQRISSNSNHKIIIAERVSSAMEMIKLVKKGWQLLFYIDGNKGANGNKTHDNMVSVSFLESNFHVRKGIAQISYITNTPVTSLMSYRASSHIFENTIHYLNTITPNRTIPRAQFTLECTQKIYNDFSEVLKRYPEQWEGWLYIQQFIAPSPMKKNAYNNERLADFKFNDERFGIIKYKDNHYAFDFVSRNMLKLNAAHLALIEGLKTKKEDNATPIEVAQPLIHAGVLT